jgi:CheY-like chemotaxis protein
MPGKVLLIDDDEDFRASVKSLLEDHGYEVFEADSGRDGLRKVLACRPDVILLDIMMESDAEGYGVTYSLKYREEYAEVRHTPVFMISSIDEAPDERFQMAGELDMIRPDRYFAKPLDFGRLLPLLETEIRANATARA